MRQVGWIVTAATILVPPGSAHAGHTLSAQQHAVLQRWLGAHPSFRLAATEDCGCADDIANMRAGYGGEWKAVPDYNPYLATGDFNGDGHVDFAVVLVERSGPTRLFGFAVFNGSSTDTAEEPAFFEKGRDLSRQGLFYGPPRPQPYRLVLGPFESEGSMLEPKGGSYVWVYDEP